MQDYVQPQALLPESTEELLEVVEIIKAVASPIRLQILELLRTSPRICVQDLAEILGQSSSLMSHHLCFMYQRGILGREREDQKIFYNISFMQIYKLLDCLSQNHQSLSELKVKRRRC